MKLGEEVGRELGEEVGRELGEDVGADAGDGSVGSTVEMSVLGPLEVRVDSERCDLGGPKPRLVLALLAADAGRALTVERLIDGLWGDEPPATARKSLQVHVSNLRRALAPAEILKTAPGGYLLATEGLQLDAVDFDVAVDEAAELVARDPIESAEQLSAALAMWRGPAYADLDLEPALAPEINRLTERRLHAVELRIDADLRLGRHRELLGELETLTADHPYRERFRAQQMLALYRSGRQAEALRVFSRTRDRLVDDLGIEPSAELRELEAQVLAQSTALDPEALPDPVRGFLFTDIEGSTVLWESDPDAMAAALVRHDRILTDAVTDHGGVIFKHTGDGVLAVFEAGARAAAAAAVDAQTLLAAEPWPTDPAVSVRMGVDEGPAADRNGDWFGPVLNRVSRLMDAGHGGQVLVAADSVARSGQPTRPLGAVDLKGLGRVDVHQLVAGVLDRDHPELRTDRTSGPRRPGFGQSVRGYELREELGSGESGTVFRAFQASVGREVAIKVIHAELANRPAFVKRFEAEAQFVAQLEHPHVVTLHDYWREPDQAFLVMGYLRGGNVAQLLDRTTLNPPAVLRLAEQVGSALAFAHRNGVVHRDVKPANVLLDDDGNAYLGDFGLAAHRLDAESAPGGSSTVAYVAPETLAGAASDARSDQYAFGLLVAEALTGRRPELGGVALVVSEQRSDVPAELDEVLGKATHLDPLQRYDRIEDLLRAIRQALGADVSTTVAAPDPVDRRNPFKGLRAFGEVDAADFHGRESLVDELIRSVQTRGVTAAVGPSGSGKSSVVKAGVVPAIRGGALGDDTDWLVADMFPGSYPFEELEAALLRVAVDHPSGLLADLEADDRGLLRVSKQVLPHDDSKLLLVIDQFEELFSVVADDDVRRRFLALLTTVADDERSRVKVLLTMRADFFDRPLQDPEFGSVLRAGLVPVTMPSEESLAIAVSQPARDVGFALEPGLVSAVVRDVSGEPGGLPLLQYVMTELVDAASGGELTVEAYDASGGAKGSLARRAEEIHAGLSPAGQRAARDLFLRLVAVGEDAEDTRRRVRRSELASMVAETAALEQAIDEYGAFRLLSFDHDPVTRGPTVEVAHESLIREWPRYQDWIDERREDLLLERRLEAAAAEWDSNERHPDFLLTGGRFEQLREWADTTDIRLTEVERELLDASAARAGELAEEAADNERRDDRLRRRSRLLVGAALATVVLLIAAGLAVAGQRAAESLSDELAAARRAQRLAAAADARLTVDPPLAVGLAIEAARATSDFGLIEVEALDALHFALQESRVTFPADDSTPVAVRPGPDGLAGIFLLPVPELVAFAQDTVVRPFTADECSSLFPGEECPDPLSPLTADLEPLGGLDEYLALTDPEQPLQGTTVLLKAALASDPEVEGIQFAGQAVLDPLGVELEYRSIGFEPVFRADRSERPGLLVTPQPQSLRTLIADRRLIDLRPVLGDAGLERRFGRNAISLASPTGSAEGDPAYAVPWNTTDKSSIHYSRSVFARNGYELPTTWDELTTLADTMVADGVTPFCWAAQTRADVEFGGFVVTDWIELLLLKEAGPQVFDAWVRGDLPFDSPEVRRAFERLAELSLAPGYSGVAAADIPFANLFTILFSVAEGDLCAMALVPDFAAIFMGPDERSGLGVFPFPAINSAGEGTVLVGGNFAGLDVDRPEYRAALRAMTSADYYDARLSTGRFFVPPDSAYLAGSTAEGHAAFAAQLQAAIDSDGWRFDGSDQMPSEVGGDAFFRLPMDLFLRGSDEIDEIVRGLDAVWPGRIADPTRQFPSNPLHNGDGPMPPGRYTTDVLGPEARLTLSTEETYYAVGSGAGQAAFVEIDRNPNRPRSRFMVRSLTGWRTAAEAVELEARGSIPPNDVDGWLAQADVIVRADSVATVGGHPARRLEVAVDPDSGVGDGVCPPDLQPCLWASNTPVVALANGDLWPLDSLFEQTLYIVDLGPEVNPLLIMLNTRPGDDEALDRLERLVESITLG